MQPADSFPTAQKGVTPPGEGPSSASDERLEELVLRARGGGRQAFGALYGQHEAFIHGVLLARVGPHRAKDLVQEVFLKALRGISSLREASQFGAWLRSIAVNVANDALRHAKGHCEEGLLREPSVVDPRRSEALEVLGVIRRLPEAYRETLVLRLVEGMTGPEIAQKTGLSAGSVRVNLHRGMKLLRERLAEDGASPHPMGGES